MMDLLNGHLLKIYKIFLIQIFLFLLNIKKFNTQDKDNAIYVQGNYILIFGMEVIQITNNILTGGKILD